MLDMWRLIPLQYSLATINVFQRESNNKLKIIVKWLSHVLELVLLHCDFVKINLGLKRPLFLTFSPKSASWELLLTLRCFVNMGPEILQSLLRR